MVFQVWKLVVALALAVGDWLAIDQNRNAQFLHSLKLGESLSELLFVSNFAIRVEKSAYRLVDLGMAYQQIIGSVRRLPLGAQIVAVAVLAGAAWPILFRGLDWFDGLGRKRRRGRGLALALFGLSFWFWAWTSPLSHTHLERGEGV